MKRIRVLLPAYLRTRISGRPFWACLMVTRRCNLDCRYCFVRNPKDHELPKEGMIGIIEKLYALGIRVLSLTGGEPTLRSDLIDLISHASNRGMMVYLSTKGTLLTPEYISRLIGAGLDGIVLSVDSVVFDGCMQKSYEGRRETLNHLMKANSSHGLEIVVGTFLTTQNVDGILDVIRVFHELKLTLSIGIINDNTYSHNHMDRSLFFSKPEEKEKLYRRIEQIKGFKRDGYRILEPLQFFDDMARFANGDLSDWDCPAGRMAFAVNCDGRVQLCSSLPPEDFSVFDLDEVPRRVLQSVRDRRFKNCKKLCLATCEYNTSYTARHPLRFLKDAVFHMRSF